MPDFAVNDEPNLPSAAPTWSDYGRTVLQGVEGMGAALQGARRYINELVGADADAELAGAREQLINIGRQETMAGMSEAGRARLESSITSGEFWSHPFSATALKVAGMTPALAAGLLPGGAVTGALAKTLAIAGAGGAINTAQMLDEYYGHVDSLGDDELQKQSATYRGLRQMMGEKDARREFDQANLGAKPLITFLVSSAAGALTPAAQAGRALAGGAGAIGAGERGLLGRIGLSAGEGALGGAMQSGSAEAAVQHALVQGGLQPNIDTDKLVGAVLEGGVLGAAMGAPLGIPGGRRGRATRAETKLEGVTPEVTAREEHNDIEASPENTSEPPKRGYAGQGSAPPPNENVAVGDEQNKVTKDGGNSGKFSKKGALGRAAIDTGKRRSKKAQQPESAAFEGISPEVQLALNSKQAEGAPPPKPEDVIAQSAEQAVAQVKANAQAARERRAQLEQAALEQARARPETQPTTPAEQTAPPPTEVAPTLGNRTGEAPIGSPQPDLTTRVAQLIKYAEQRPVEVRPIPEGANSSRKAGGPVYIDASIPEWAHPFIKIHETVEEGLMDQGYDRAHKLATLVEKHAVEQAGIPWDSYEHKVDHALKATENEAPTVQPADKHVTTEEALGKAPNETLGPAAVRVGDKVFTGTIHADAAEKAFKETGRRDLDQDGWVTSTGRFVGRREAKEIAARTGRLSDGSRESLFVEDLEPATDLPAKQARILEDVSPQGKKARILEDVSPQGKEARKQALAAEAVEVSKMREEAKAAEKKLAGPVEGSGHRTAAEKEVRANKEKFAEKILVEYRGKPEETPEQTIERARAIVTAAKEAKVEPDKKLVGNKVSGGRLVLTEAASLVKAADAGKPKADMLVRVTRFRKREADAHAGEVKAALEERRAEGDELKRVKQKEVEGIAKTPEKEHTDAVEVTGEGGTIAKEFREENQDIGTSATEHGRKATTIQAETEKARLKGKEGEEIVVERAKAASEVRVVSAEEAAEIAKRLGLTIKPKKAAEAVGVSKQRSEVAIQPQHVRIIRENIDPNSMRRVVESVKPGRAEERQTLLYKADKISDLITRIDKAIAVQPKNSKEAFELGWLRQQILQQYKAELKQRKGIGYVGPGAIHATDSPFTSYYYGGFPSKEAEAAFYEAIPEERMAISGEPRTNDNLPPLGPQMMFGRNKPPKAGLLDRIVMRASGFDTSPHEFAAWSYSSEKGNGRQVKATALAKTTLRNALRSQITENIGGQLAPYLGLIRERIIHAVGDIPVRVVSDEELARINSEDPRSLQGMAAGAQYDPINHQILVAKSTFDDGIFFNQALLHEAAHAATTRVIGNEDVHIRRIMNEVAKAKPELKDEYGFTNEHEFIAEALSNPEFQSALMDIKVSDDLARDFGIKAWREGTIWEAIVRHIQRLLKLPENAYTALEATLRVAEQRMHEMETNLGFPGVYKRLQNRWIGAASHLEKGILESVTDAAKSLFERPELQRQLKRPLALILRTTDQIAQVAESYFGGNNPVRAIANAREKMHVYAQKLLGETEPLIARVAEMSKRYAGPEWEKFQNFVVDETMAGVHASVPLTDEANSHVHFAEKGVEHLSDVWSRAQHAKLYEVYRSLPGDLKLLHKQMLDYFPKTQNDMALGTIQNRVLKALGHDDASLARRIFDKEVTDDDLKTLGDGDLDSGRQVYDIIKKASVLAKIMGPYHPLMRRGDYVVRATLEVTAPKSATPVKDEALPTFDFKDRDQAAAWVREQDGRTSLQSVWVDKNTGDTRFPDGTKVTKNDIDAEQRFRAQVQNRHVEFFETAKDAQKAAAELESEIGARRVKGVEHRAYEPKGRDADLQASQITSLLNSMQARSGWSKLSGAEKHFITQALNELAIRSMGSTRIQSRRLPRRHVAGASTDILRNTYDYALSTSQHLAKLKYAPELENAVNEMDRQVGGEYGKEGTLSRSTIAHEIHKRLDQDLFDGGDGAWNAWTKRLVTASFLDKLFGPSNSVINATQPAMLTMPVLGARHGVTRAFTEMRRAYSDVGGLSVVKQGLQASYAKAMRRRTPVNFLEDIIARAARTKGEGDMLRELADVGSISPDSGLEVSELLPAKRGIGGKVDVPLHYLEGIARQMPRAIEAINRTTTALAAYRLELAKGASHEEAVKYAQKTVNNTQFLYSPTNRAAWMNHPLAKLTLQFKQYAQGVYHLIGSNIGKAMSGATREERAEAIKTLVGIAATHTAMAGMLGLPTEPFKYLLMGANAAGLTNYQWQDVEDKARDIANGLFGKGAGEAITRGLPRLLGVDISSRVGLDSLTSFGEPRSTKESDVKSWLWDTLSGAPVSLLGDWAKASNQLMAGNFEKAAELGVPIKTFADAMRAYRQATEGKKKASGVQSMTPYGPYEAAVRTLGFTPAREAEEGARASYFYRNQARDKQDRTNLMNQWLNASPSEKSGAWSAITHWNQSQRPEQRIKMSELSSSLRNRDKAQQKEIVPGIKTSKRDKYLLETNPY